MSLTPSTERTPSALHERAMADLQFIRRTMEGAAAFTTLSGLGLLAIGLSALGAGVLAGSVAGPEWLRVWVVDAALALLIGVATTMRKTRAAGLPIANGPLRKFGLALAAPSLAGAVLTIALAVHGSFALLPGVWLLLYGSGLLAGGMFSIRLVPVMGGCFMALGVAASLLPLSLGPVAMITGFGGLHIVFGALIARGHGG